MNKVIIFSHESDIDGLGNIILGKLAFKEIDYVLLSDYKELELIFRNYLELNKLNDYDKIFITDLALADPSLTMVNNSDLKNKVLVFDHHKMAILSNLDRYFFTTIIEEDEVGKKCATELFYEYLIENNFLMKTKAIEDFVELTRLEDVWEWKEQKEFGLMAHDLAILLNAIGKDEYIKRMVEKLLKNKNAFYFDDEEIIIIQNKQEEYNNNLKELALEIECFVDENKNKYGIVYANYEYRNELTDYIINNNPEHIKYLIIVALNKGEYGQKSYRKVDDLIDVNEIAMKHGGGGHPGAASVNITKEQKEKALLLTKREGLEYLANSNCF